MPSQRNGFEFGNVLPSLVAAYEAGRLVPFIGVGMSRPHCADWPGLIRGLEQAARVAQQSPITEETKSEELIQRANRAVRKLRSGAAGEFEQALGESLFLQKESVPEQTRALAKIWWPLVLTTNYDNFFVRAFADEFGEDGLAVVGRGSEDCQRVLTSLNTAGRSLLWAIQGHLAAPLVLGGHADDQRLTKELVLDHTEYRRVTHREPHFRRAFAEVFRHRSFLFLGSGLRETYLQELFGEVLELYGPSTHTHFAIMPRGQVDPSFMYSRFQVAVVEYEPDPRHGEVRQRVEELRGAIERNEAAHTSWSWGHAVTAGHMAHSARADFEIVRGPLPLQRVPEECLVLSAGGSLDQDSFYVSPMMRKTLEAWCGPSVPAPRIVSKFVAEYDDRNAFAVRARKEHEDTKDLLQVRNAALALFDEAARRFGCMRMQLLASGGKDFDDRAQPRHSVRVFPARFAFVELVRAWGTWRRANPDCSSRLVLHVIDPSVYREVASGRIDVLELLLCVDVRFWSEIIEDRVLVERRQFKTDETTSLHEIADELGLSEEHWTFEVSPKTGIDDSSGSNDGDRQLKVRAHAFKSIRELGVVPGSTLHFRRLREPERTGRSGRSST